MTSSGPNNRGNSREYPYPKAWAHTEGFAATAAAFTDVLAWFRSGHFAVRGTSTGPLRQDGAEAVRFNNATAAAFMCAEAPLKAVVVRDKNDPKEYMLYTAWTIIDSDGSFYQPNPYNQSLRALHITTSIDSPNLAEAMTLRDVYDLLNPNILDEHNSVARDEDAEPVVLAQLPHGIVSVTYVGKGYIDWEWSAGSPYMKRDSRGMLVDQDPDESADMRASTMQIMSGMITAARSLQGIEGIE